MNESDAADLVTALFDRWYMLLVRYGLRTTANYELAEDLAQDALMQLYQALRAGKEIQHPKAWTICVLRRNMYKQIKDRNLQEQLDETDIPGEVVTETLKLGDIRDLLSVLSPREEEVLLLRLDALKYREIADQLGISMNSVNALLARALRKLQVAMLERRKSKGKIEMRINRLREHPKDEILLAYLDGELSHGQMREIRAHLMICWQCRSALSELECQAEAISQLLSAHSNFDLDRSVRAKEKFLRWRTAFESTRKSLFGCQPPQLLRNAAGAVLA